MSVTVAALFVATGGCYSGVDGVDPWDVTRDARRYAGPHPVVAHPPCERWGRYWSGGPSARERRTLGDDGGCFAAALAAVRTWGAYSSTRRRATPSARTGSRGPRGAAGWVSAGDDAGGSACCVAQGHYGHRARKLTWLYACRVPSGSLPDLDWSIPEPRSRLDYGFHSAAERARLAPTVAPRVNEGRLTARENLATPAPFRDVLVGIARSVVR